MATGIESALVKPVVDGLIALFKKAKNTRLKSTAEQALTEAIRELLLAPGDLRSAEAKIAVAKAAGIINTDLVLAEDMLIKHKVAETRLPLAKKATSGKVAPGKKATPSSRPVSKKAVPARKRP